jgi:hypothetical protein
VRQRPAEIFNLNSLEKVVNDKNLSLIVLEDIEAPMIAIVLAFAIGFAYGYYSH